MGNNSRISLIVDLIETKVSFVLEGTKQNFSNVFSDLGSSGRSVFHFIKFFNSACNKEVVFIFIQVSGNLISQSFFFL